jgi:hypothetical protein
VGAPQPPAGLQQATEERAGDAERWVGHHVEGLAGQAQVGGVGSDHHDAVTEALPEGGGAPRVGLHRDHPRPDVEERSRHRPLPRTHVDDEVAPADAGVADELVSLAGAEAVPSPLPSGPAHAAGP